MNFDLRRYKILDWAVLAIFVVAIVGISVPWWHVKMPKNAGGDLAGSFGISMPAMPSMPSIAYNGWNSQVIGTGRTTFVLSLIAFLAVVGKAFFPAGAAIPSWYKESWILLGFGGLSSLLGLLGCLIPPQGGYQYWSWSLGCIITFIAALALFGSGYLMLKDKTGDYDGQGRFKIPSIGGQSSPSGDK
jgi:hypothetical protein